jgi:hypothetical protein
MQEGKSDLIYWNYAWVYEYLKNGNGQANGLFYVATEDITVFGKHTQNETIMAAAEAGCRASNAQRMLDTLEAFINEKQAVIFDLNPQKWNE